MSCSEISESPSISTNRPHSNLVNANHVIFLSPPLADTQQQYDQSTKQSIGRVRRTGQEKTVHIYRFAAINTIDVDILETREKRTTCLGQKYIPAGKQTKADVKPETTKLVRGTDGKFSLVPKSWLNDQKAMEEKGITVEESNFRSLEKFSESYILDGDE